ncbi:hypothetical protein [Stratiformator vulcanicus]|uniref:Uncharacterized protein n=1 Tax=Stratiformator vulcanicus TaxID=2527980 RepID=A0A517R068_9PLAN|nr:hypothetical protein [Stratiformator vulcanicus]QDT37292.1 hypothetical protein Pan189_16650 [Stratiformator vulcanicus]
MVRNRLRAIAAVGLTVVVGSLAVPTAQAQGNQRGFAVTAEPSVSGEELTTQTDLWVLEVDLKPARLIRVGITDPKSGEKTEELIWYLVYRVKNRALKTPPETPDLDPVNVYDDPPGPSLIIPRFLLVTQDGDAPVSHFDVTIPEAQAAIERREMRGDLKDTKLNNSVSIVQPIPKRLAEGEKPDRDDVIYGVAMWRNIDPETDFFRVALEGFSNGYQEMKGPGGQPMILRRVLVQDFWRPGDQFEEEEKEFQFKGGPRWLYLPDEELRQEGKVDLGSGS